MPATKVNLNGIDELDLNLAGTTTASTAAGVTTITNTPAIATATTVGVVKPDNTTIQITADGTLSSSGSAPSFVQGASSTSVTATMSVGLTGISNANTLLLHLKCGNSTPPTWTSTNAYTLIGTVSNGFWGVYTYTYICLTALPGAETISVSGLTGTCAALLAEYTSAGGYEAFGNNNVSANAVQSSTQSITSTKNFERAVFFFTSNAQSGIAYTQTVRTNTTSGAVTLMDAASLTSGTTTTELVTAGAMNQAAIVGFFLSPLGTVQSVGLTMPSDFTVTGSPVTSAGVLQVTGGVTRNNVQQNALVYATDTGAANAYAVTLSPVPTVVAGSEVIFKAAQANTGASTLAVNGVVYPLTKNGAAALTLGDILVGQMVTAKCDGTNFQITGGGGASGVTSLNTLTGGLTLGAGTNVTITPSGSTLTIASSGGVSNFSPYPVSLTPPLSAGFTWVNQGTSTNTDKTSRMVVTVPGVTTSVQARFLVSTSALPVAPYTIDIGGMMAANTIAGNGIILGAAVLDNSNNAVSFGLFANPNSGGSSSSANQIFRGFWTASGATLSSSATQNMNSPGNALFFVRITDDGTHRNFYYSHNGRDYYAFTQENSNTNVTPTKPGIMFYNNQGFSGPTEVGIYTIYHYLVSNSVLPQFSA